MTHRNTKAGYITLYGKRSLTLFVSFMLLRMYLFISSGHIQSNCVVFMLDNKLYVN